MDINLGYVYNFKTAHGESVFRVIGSDEYEVFCDEWREHTESWGLGNIRTTIFSRIERKAFEGHSKLLREAPLTDKEIEKLNPKLPHRTSILADWNWDQSEYISFSDYILALENLAEKLEIQPSIESSKIALIPFGPHGGPKPRVIVEAEDGRSFSPSELLWKAHAIQSKYKTNIENGVGIYRLGISNNIPSYYLGGTGDLAGHFKL